MIVVVGGGIVGLACAYYLARAGAEVTVLEKGSLGNQSTGRSAGGIRMQFSTRVNVELSKRSVAVWERFGEDFGVDIAFRRAGYLFLARDDDTAERFERNVRLQNDLGVDSRLLEPAEARRHCPGVLPDRFVAATYHAGDGFADPNLAVQGFAGATTDAGVDVRTGVRVEGIDRRDGRVCAVETDAGSIAAEVVVDAAGAWSGHLARMVGVDLPIAPRRRQVLTVDPSEAVPESVPLTIDLDTGSYFRPEREGAAIVGGHFGGEDPDVDPDAYSTSYDQDWALEALERAADYTTYFGPETRIRNGWAGLYAVTPDHHPIVDEVLPGVVVAAGFSGHGFQHAPATGQLVAELVTEGEVTSLDIDPLSADRFEAGAGKVERNVA